MALIRKHRRFNLIAYFLKSLRRYNVLILVLSSILVGLMLTISSFMYQQSSHAHDENLKHVRGRLKVQQNRKSYHDQLKHIRGALDVGSDACWVKNAFKLGTFKVFSHRSFVDAERTTSRTCRGALRQLKNIGVSNLDIDLVYDAKNESVKVAHPMEFKHESNYYSPCANTNLDEFIKEIYLVFGSNHFVSMELKASWENTRVELEDPALARPEIIMEAVLDTLESVQEIPLQCAIIVNPSKVNSDAEFTLFNTLKQKCKLFNGFRVHDKLPDELGSLDALMPTIEFHPEHSNNPGSVIPGKLNRASILWIVDSIDDLILASSLHPLGIVSNSPKIIVNFIESLMCPN